MAIEPGEAHEELRRELQRMRGWKEAAMQLEQKNAKLLALNRVRLSPRMTFVTGEVLHGPATTPLADRSELLAAAPAPRS